MNIFTMILIKHICKGEMVRVNFQKCALAVNKISDLSGNDGTARMNIERFHWSRGFIHGILTNERQLY